MDSSYVSIGGNWGYHTAHNGQLLRTLAKTVPCLEGQVDSSYVSVGGNWGYHTAHNGQLLRTLAKSP